MLARSTLDRPAIETLPAAGAVTAEAPPQPEFQTHWSLATRIAFRFCFVYFSLYVISTQMLSGLLVLPNFGVPSLGHTAVTERTVTWVGTHVFHIGYQYSFATTGSGDKTVDYLQAFSLAAMAVIAAALWSVLDRRRLHYRGLNKWFRLFLRFSVGSTMLSYGMVKAIPMQMPAPGLTRLLEPFGNFSPMGVLWYSVGASKGYEVFAGFMELTGGVLLFVPRLATLGALVTLADVVQIFTLNMTYDVPVKLFSFHLILMSLFLIAPEASRIADVLVFNRVAKPSAQPPLFRTRRGVMVALAVQLVFGAYLIGMSYRGARQSWWQYGGGAPKSPLYGIWDVERMTIDGQIRSPLVTDYGRWRRVIFQTPASVSFQRMDDTFAGYGAAIDMTAKTLTVTTGNKASPPSRLSFQRPDPEHLILDGSMEGRVVRMETRLFDRSKFLLVSRGFNWIQERPFNR